MLDYELERKMNQEERIAEIKKLLKKEHKLTTRQLAQHFQVSFDTARRDVLRLTTTGQAIRIHGGLMEINQNNVPDFLARNQIQSPVKNKMAKMAKTFIHPGQCDFIGSSTTLKLMCPLINGMNLQVVTNSIDNALNMMESSLPKIRLLGGVINKEQRFIFSEAALDTLRRIRFNTAFIGTASINKDGIYMPNMSDANIVKIAAEHSNLVVLIAENYKFENQNSAPFKSIGLDKIDVLITDSPLAKEKKSYFDSHTQIISVLKE